MSDREKEIAAFVGKNHCWKVSDEEQEFECRRILELLCECHKQPQPPTPKQREAGARALQKEYWSHEQSGVPWDKCDKEYWFRVWDRACELAAPSLNVERLRKERNEYQRGYEEQARQLAHKNAKLAEITKERDELAERNANQAQLLIRMRTAVKAAINHPHWDIEEQLDGLVCAYNTATAKLAEAEQERDVLRRALDGKTSSYNALKKMALRIARERNEAHAKLSARPALQPQITDAAVEAVAKAMGEEWYPLADWNRPAGYWMNKWSSAVRICLAAALPHLYPVPARNLSEPGVEVRL